MPPTVAEQLGILLSSHQQRIVLAESCTGGMAAALLTRVPGISKWFCGSAVTYRENTKQQWLDIAESTIERFTAESLPTSDELAIRVLVKTPEANHSAAITGHLGPGVGPEIDGLVFISIAARNGNPCQPSSGSMTIRTKLSRQHRLRTETRRDRQIEAAELLLNELAEYLRTTGYSSKPE